MPEEDTTEQRPEENLGAGNGLDILNGLNAMTLDNNSSLPGKSGSSDSSSNPALCYPIR